MTTEELRIKFNNEFGLGKWPETYEVDTETYANICQSIFEHQAKTVNMYWDVIEDGEQKPDIKTVAISLGRSNGIMFKNVELILKRG
jgi:hypothetical protein